MSERAARREPDIAAAALLEHGNRWKSYLNAVGTSKSGAELDQVSARDFDNLRYGSELAGHRGLGATIAACRESLPAALDLP